MNGESQRDTPESTTSREKRDGLGFKVRAELKKLGYPILCALIGSATGFLLLRWPGAVAVAAALGIVVGHVVAERVFKRVGVEVWLSPIGLAFAFAALALSLSEGPSITGMMVATLGLQIMFVVAVGTFGAFYVMSRVERARERISARRLG